MIKLYTDGACSPNPGLGGWAASFNYKDNKYITYAFEGITCGVSFLILKTGISMLKNIKNRFSLFILILTISTMFIINIFTFNISVIYLILIGGVLGLIYYSIENKKGKVNL